MREEELIKALKEMDKKRVEKLNDNARNLFNAIMDIANERDRLKEEKQELQKYKSLYENEKDHTDTLKRIIKKIEYVVVNEELGETIDGKPYYLANDLIGEKILDLLKEIK